MKKVILIILALTCAQMVTAQGTPVALAPPARQQFFSAAGVPLAGGLVYTYQAGTSTPAATYVDSTGTIQNTNPIVLDAGGFATIWLSAQPYKICVANSSNVQQYCVDQINQFGILGGNTWITAQTFNAAMNANAGGNLAGTFTGNPTLSGNPIFSGQPTFTGNFTAGSINSIRYVDGVEYTTIASAISSLPGGGGTVIVPCGTYTLSATLVIPSNVILAGCGMGSTGSGGTRLIASSGSVTPLVEVQGSSSSSRSTNIFIRDVTIGGVYTTSQVCMQIDHASYVSQEHVQYTNCGQAEWDDDVYRSLHNDVSYFQSGSGGTNTTATVRVENTSNPSVPSEEIFFDTCIWEGGTQQGTAVYFGPATEEEHILGSKMDYGSTSPGFPVVYIYQAQVVDISHNSINGFDATSPAPGVIEIEGSSGTPAFQVHISENSVVAFSAAVPGIYLDYATDAEVLGGTFEGPGSGGTAVVTTANTHGAGIGPFRMASADTPVTDTSMLSGIIYSDPSTNKMDVNNLDVLGTLSVGTANWSSLYSCGDAVPCASTLLTNSKIVFSAGSYALSGGTLIVGGFPFTNSSSWTCNAWDITTPANGVAPSITSGSSVTFNGTSTDHFTFTCQGN